MERYWLAYIKTFGCDMLLYTEPLEGPHEVIWMVKMSADLGLESGEVSTWRRN
jgi:hypothetical protein